MIDLRPRTPPRKLHEVLEITDSYDFLRALVDLAVPPGTNHIPLEERHQLRQMIVILNAIYLCVETDGIWKFLIQDGMADWFAKAQVWARHIEARRASDYFAAIAAVFPDGKIPSDEDERADLLLDSAEVSHGLRQLDRAYKGVMDEMAESLRAHIRLNLAVFTSELEGGAAHDT
jgi:hypothetical protein